MTERFLESYLHILLYRLRSVEHHFSSFQHHLLSTETHVSKANTSNIHNLPFYLLTLDFDPKQHITSVHASILLTFVDTSYIFLNFPPSGINLSINIIKYIGTIYLPLNSTNYEKLFDYLNSEVQHLLFSLYAVHGSGTRLGALG